MIALCPAPLANKPPWQNKSFVSTSERVPKYSDSTFSRRALFHMKTRVSLKYFETGLTVLGFCGVLMIDSHTQDDLSEVASNVI